MPDSKISHFYTPPQFTFTPAHVVKSFLIFFFLPHSQDEPSEMLVLFSPGSDSSFNSNNKLASRKKGLYKGLCELHSDYEVNNVTNPVAESMTT